MDEYNSGIDPEIRRIFRKITVSIFYLVLWMIGSATAGMFFHLGEINEGLTWYNVLFYVLSFVTFILLIRYLYNTWSHRS